MNTENEKLMAFLEKEESKKKIQSLIEEYFASENYVIRPVTKGHMEPGADIRADIPTKASLLLHSFEYDKDLEPETTAEFIKVFLKIEASPYAYSELYDYSYDSDGYESVKGWIRCSINKECVCEPQEFKLDPKPNAVTLSFH